MIGGRGGNDLPTPHSPKHCEGRKEGRGRKVRAYKTWPKNTLSHLTSGATRVIEVPISPSLSFSLSLSYTHTLTCGEGCQCSTAPPRATGVYVSPRGTPEAPRSVFVAFPYKYLCCTVPQGGSVLAITLRPVSRLPFRVRRSLNPDKENERGWKGEGRGERNEGERERWEREREREMEEIDRERQTHREREIQREQIE